MIIKIIIIIKINKNIENHAANFLMLPLQLSVTALPVTVSKPFRGGFLWLRPNLVASPPELNDRWFAESSDRVSEFLRRNLGMAILYGVVARGTTVLAEFSAVTGNTGAVVRRILEKLSESDSAESRLCFSQDRYIFHILRSDGITFLCMANDTFGSKALFRNWVDFYLYFVDSGG